MRPGWSASRAGTVLYKLWSGLSPQVRPSKFVHFPWLPKIPVTSDSSLCFLWSHRDLWIQLDATPPFGTVDVPPCSSILSSPNSSCFLGPGLSKKSELEQRHSNPVYGLGAQLASAPGLMNLYLGTSKPHRLQTTGHG